MVSDANTAGSITDFVPDKMAICALFSARAENSAGLVSHSSSFVSATRGARA